MRVGDGPVCLNNATHERRSSGQCGCREVCDDSRHFSTASHIEREAGHQHRGLHYQLVLTCMLSQTPGQHSVAHRLIDALLLPEHRGAEEQESRIVG